MISLDLLEPPIYQTAEHIFDLSFHPQADIVTCCTIEGEVQMVSYSLEDTKEVLNLKPHKKSCRTCLWSPDGKYLITGSEDKSIAIIDCDGKIANKIRRAHEHPLYSLYFINENIFASGDDEGFIKIWDLRTSESIYQVHEQQGSITGFAVNEDKTLLLSTCTDGMLGVYDLRKPNSSEDKLYAISDSMDEDLLSVVIVKGGKKVLCSSQEGVIFIFKWELFGDCSDRILGHPNSIDTMIKLDENTVLTGSEDGFLRGVSIGPNKILALLGQHSESDDTQPITRIAQSRSANIVASISHDSIVKFYNISQFLEKRKNPEIIDDEEVEMETNDMDDEENMEDLEDDDDNNDKAAEMIFEMGKKKEPKFPKKTTLKERVKDIEKSKKQNFFSDL